MVRTRFAPSPTGSLHVGNARIAILNWLFTRQQGGEFVLRIEDTDLERNVAGAERQIFDDLHWLGLDWDEGPVVPGGTGSAEAGAYGPYRQTERLPIYRAYLDRLIEAGAVYRCYCTPEELAALRESGAEGAEQGIYPGTCRRATPEQIARWEAEGRKPAWRFHVRPGRTVVTHDLVFGDVSVRSDDVSDFIVMRSDGVPTYNFGVVVDDITMAITHVIRGVGHLSNTTRQILLYEALGAPLPQFAHIPMVLGPDRQKLSKRHGAQALSEYRAAGYHPDGILNYLSLLSWSSPSGEEVLSRERLIEEIDLSRIGNADVVFDPVKLSWLSAKHIERMSLEDLVHAVEPFLDRSRFDLSGDRLRIAVNGIRTHLSRFGEINEQLEPYFPDGTAYTPPDDSARAVIRAALERLEQVTDWTEQTLNATIRQAGQQVGVKGRALFEPLRRALTGREHGPPLPAVMVVQGRERVLAAFRAAL